MAGHPIRCEPRSQVLIYDGECQLCVTTRQRLERVGVGTSQSDVRFIPYQSEEARQLLGQSYRPGRPEMAFLVGPSGDIREGLDAYLPLVPGLPGGPVILRLLRIPFATTLAAWSYRIMARYRYRLFGEVRRSPPHS